MSRLDRKREGAAGFAKEQPYSYGLNGNRTLDERGSHVFNAGGQLVGWTSPSGVATSYSLNAAGAVLSQQSGTGPAVTFEYAADGRRLVGAVKGGVRTTYRYGSDGFGNMTGYGLEGQPAQVEFEFDAFGRMVSSNRSGTTAQFAYDGLDRRDTRTVGGRTFDLSYVGSSEALSQEQEFGGQGDLRSFDYASSGERLGMARKQSPTDPSARYLAFLVDANGSVEGLEDEQGQPVGKRYAYEPYGAQTTPNSQLSGDARANPFRFQGHYFDTAAESYDMRAREYLPETGRFLQEDRFEDPLADRTLATQPATGDRYLFAAGNPVDNVEFDGHYSGTSDHRSRRIQTQGGRVHDREAGQSGYSAPAEPPQQSGEAPLTDVSSSGMSVYSDKRLVAPPRRREAAARLGLLGAPAPAAGGGGASAGELAGGVCGALEGLLGVSAEPMPTGGPCSVAGFHFGEDYERGAGTTRPPAQIAGTLNLKGLLQAGGKKLARAVGIGGAGHTGRSLADEAIEGAARARGNQTFYKRIPSGEIDEIGMQWVRDPGGSPRPIHDRVTGNQVGWISEDARRVYRFPQRKTSGPSAGDIQANLVDKTPGGASNLHITILP